MIRDAAGKVEKIVEFRDASPAERAIKEINTGCYIVDCELLRSALAELKPSNAQDEYYLTDIVAIARARRETKLKRGWLTTRRSSPESTRARSWQIWKRKFVRRLTES